MKASRALVNRDGHKPNMMANEPKTRRATAIMEMVT